MEWSWLPGLVALVALLFLMTRGVPHRHLLVAAAVTLALVLAVLLIERAGLWPQDLRTR